MLKLPATCNYSGSPTLEDDNDWLSVVFENRKAPPSNNKRTDNTKYTETHVIIITARYSYKTNQTSKQHKPKNNPK